MLPNNKFPDDSSQEKRKKVQEFRNQRFRIQRFWVQGSKVQDTKGSGFWVQRFRG